MRICTIYDVYICVSVCVCMCHVCLFVKPVTYLSATVRLMIAPLDSVTVCVCVCVLPMSSSVRSMGSFSKQSRTMSRLMRGSDARSISSSSSSSSESTAVSGRPLRSMSPGSHSVACGGDRGLGLVGSQVHITDLAPVILHTHCHRREVHHTAQASGVSEGSHCSLTIALTTTKT